MTLKRGAIYVAAILILAGLWYLRHRQDNKTTAQIKSVTLPANDQVKFIIDPARHSITTVTRSATGQLQTRATFLPSRGASLEVRRDGSVLVTAPTWGTEISPFVGVALGVDLVGRAALGLNLLYIQRWELGGGLLVNQNIRDTRAFAHVSYNPYKSIFVSAGIDNRLTAQIITGLKF